MTKKIEGYGPPLCCPTGVCGPSVDPVLALFAADVEWLRGQRVIVERFNLPQDPGAFAQETVVRNALETGGNDSLPLIVRNGEILSQGRYPPGRSLPPGSGLRPKGMKGGSGFKEIRCT